MPLLRCPKFLRCPAADACNFERGYSLILFLPPSAALDLRPTSARLICTPPPHTRRGDPCGRPPRLAPHLLPHSRRAGCTHPAALLVLCHCEVSAYTGCGNPHPPVPHLLLCFRRGRCPCCGAQNFCAAPRRTLVILNAATRSFCFFRHRRRWICAPHRPVSYALPHPTPVGATLAVAHPGSHRTYCHTPIRRGALTPPPSSHCVIAKPVRTLAVAIYAPCTALSSLRLGHSPPPHPTKMR